MTKKNILQLISSTGFYGAENVIIELAKSLIQSDYYPIIGVIKNNYNPHLEIADIAKKYNLETMLFECNSQLSLKTVFEIRKFVKERDIEIIHPHGYKSNFYAVLSALLSKTSLICTCHPWLETNENNKAKIYTWLDQQLLLKRFKKIVAVSEQVKNEIIASGIPEYRISLINNGIDIERYSNSYKRNEIYQKFNIIQDCKIIGTIGRLSKEKAHEVLINAAHSVLKIIPESYFIIVGDGPLNKELKKIVFSLNLQDKILFTGTIENIPEILSIMDIFVLPSLSEGLPMAILEAMAAQKPVIATSVGAIPTIIKNKDTGILIPPGNEKELSGAIIGLLSNEKMSDQLADNALSKVRNEFSSETMSKEYMKLYTQMI